MKKTGQFFFTFLPLLSVIGLQFALTFFAMGISGLWEGIWFSGSKSVTISDILMDLSGMWSSNSFNTGIMILYACVCIGIFGIWYYARYDGTYLVKPKSIFHPLSILGIAMLVVGAQYLSSYLISFVASIFPHWLEVYVKLMETAGLDDNITFGLFLYSVLLAPFSEELIFRGVTMRQAKKVFPFWAANLMQAVLFGVFHMNMIQGIYAFFLGLLLGYVCEKSGSIYNSILMHLLFNFWGTVLSQYFLIGNSTFSIIFWFVFGTLMTFGGLWLFNRGRQRFVTESC